MKAPNVPLLDMRGLEVSLRGQSGREPLIDGLSLTLNAGETLGLVGESGCGKSLTALSILRLIQEPLEISAGQIFLEGEDLMLRSEKEMRTLRGSAVAMIFQEPMSALDPLFTVENQMTEVLTFHGRHLSSHERREALSSILRRVGISRTSDVLASWPHQLSGGMLQRVMIAMAMLESPRLLIADEPTTALDVTIQAQILALMNELQTQSGTAILMITHDLGVVAETCRRVAVLYRGQIVEQGTVQDIFSSPLHPYTRGLLRSVHSLGAGERFLYAIRGTVPTGPLESGCRFQGRCDESEPACCEPQPLRDLGGRLCRCWKSGGTAR